MYELDDLTRAAIARDLGELASDHERPIVIEGDVWFETEKEAGYLDMPHQEAYEEVVNAVLDHPLVKLKLSESDELWEALKWVVANAEKIPFAPVDHEPVLAAIHAALGMPHMN